MTAPTFTHNLVDRKSALKSLLHREWELFQQHRMAYLSLVMAKLALLAALIHFGYTQRISFEVPTLLALSAFGVGMTVFFHRQHTPTAGEAMDDAHTLLRSASPP